MGWEDDIPWTESKKCPKCGSEDVIRVGAGQTREDADMIEPAIYHCNNCGEFFGVFA